MAHPELMALADVLGDLEPTAPTACADRTVHDLVAHLAAGAREVEVAELVEDHLAGQPARPTRGFDERERPFRAHTHPELLAALAQQSRRKIAALDLLADRGDHVAVAFTGTTMTAKQFLTHARSEAALHRWDLVGDDSVSDQLLSQPELTRHAVNVLNAMPVLDEAARILKSPVPRRIVLASPGQPAVVIETGTAGTRFEPVEIEDRDGPAKGDIVLATDPANRLLVLWGRLRMPAMTTTRTGARHRPCVPERCICHAFGDLGRVDEANHFASISAGATRRHRRRTPGFGCVEGLPRCRGSHGIRHRSRSPPSAPWPRPTHPPSTPRTSRHRSARLPTGLCRGPAGAQAA